MLELEQKLALLRAYVPPTEGSRKWNYERKKNWIMSEVGFEPTLSHENQNLSLAP